MKNSLITRALVAGLAVGSGALTFAGQADAARLRPPAKVAPTAPCATGAWSPTAQGRPAGLAAGAAQGVYLYHDGDGWHLRVTHPGNQRVVFTGVIDSSRVGDLTGTRALESNDTVVITPAAGKIHFRLVNKGGIDGIDFRVGCSNKFTVRAEVNGAPIANNQVFIGAASTNPTSVPFTMERS